MSNKISEKDKKDWKNFVTSKHQLEDKDLKVQNKVYFKTRTIDLHGCTLDKANEIISDFINKAYMDKVSKLNSLVRLLKKEVIEVIMLKLLL